MFNRRVLYLFKTFRCCTFILSCSIFGKRSVLHHWTKHIFIQMIINEVKIDTTRLSTYQILFLKAATNWTILLSRTFPFSNAMLYVIIIVIIAVICYAIIIRSYALLNRETSTFQEIQFCELMCLPLKIILLNAYKV